MAIDPVCGMEVDARTAAGQSEYRGQTYYFCSPGCKRAFDKEWRLNKLCKKGLSQQGKAGRVS